MRSSARGFGLPLDMFLVYAEVGELVIQPAGGGPAGYLIS